MAVGLSLESAEKYFWTWIDLFRLGPRRFSDRWIEQSCDYLPPVQFALGTFVIYQIIIFIGAQTLEQSRLATLLPYKSYLGTDVKTYVARHTLYVMTLVGLQVLANRFVLWWPLRSPAKVKDIFIAKCYGSAAFTPYALLDAICICVIVWIAPHVSTQVTGWMFITAFTLELFFMGAFLSIFDLWTLSAFCQIRIRRLLEAQVIIIMTCVVVGATFGMVIGGTIGGIRGGWNATTVHTEFSTIYIVALSFGMAILLAAIILVPFLYLLRWRLVILQKAVKAEHASYRVIKPY